MQANGRLQRWNSKGLWPECLVEAAARDFAGKKQWSIWSQEKEVPHVVCPCETAFNFILALRSGLSEASTSNISNSSRQRHWLVAERRWKKQAGCDTRIHTTYMPTNFCSRLWGSWLWFGDIIVRSDKRLSLKLYSNKVKHNLLPEETP